MDLGGPTRIASCLALVKLVFGYQSQRSVRQKDHPGKISQEGYPPSGCASRALFHGLLLGVGARDASRSLMSSICTVATSWHLSRGTDILVPNVRKGTGEIVSSSEEASP